jgi:hypothetical protein
MRTAEKQNVAVGVLELQVRSGWLRVYGRLPRMKDVLAVGWDVGGWRGSKQAVAVTTWERGAPEWPGEACCLKLADLPADWGLQDLVRLAWQDAPGDLLQRYRVVLAIDAPLGFPIAFADLLAGKPAPSFGPDGGEIDNPLAYRVTDRHVFEQFKKKPLSASFDKLGNNATVAMVHTRRLRAKGQLRVPPFDAVEDGIATGIEVYPALVKQKRTHGDREKLRCIPRVEEMLPSGMKPGDECDACVCALMALAFGHAGRANGLPTLIESRPVTEQIGREGWIYHPDPSWTI